MKSIDLVIDSDHSTEEEEKISSSSSRIRLLGTLLKPVKVHYSNQYSYITQTSEGTILKPVQLHYSNK